MLSLLLCISTTQEVRYPHRCSLLVCLIQQMDPSVSLSALTYFSLSSSAG